jgi:hypothetical protein
VILLSVYLTGQYIDTGIGFTIYWYHLPYLLIILFGIAQGKFDIKILAFIVLLIVYSLFMYHYGLGLVIKQLVNIIFSFAAFYYLIRLENYSFESILTKYVQISKVVLIVGFIQVILFSVGMGKIMYLFFPFLQFTNITARFQSITAEPSFATLGLAPLVFISLNNIVYRRSLFFSKTWSFLFVTGYLLTLASTAYAGLLIMLVILYFKNFTILKLVLASVAFAFILGIAFISYYRIEDIRVRVDDTVKGFTSDFTADKNYEKIHLSSYILLSNLYVTEKSLQERPLTGHGLGTHELTYDRHLPQPLRNYSTLNRNDAGSMAFRLLTETGVVGFFLFCYFVFSHRIKSRRSLDSSQEMLWVVNASIFVLIGLYLLRNGNYTINGKMLFFLLYYYSFKDYTASRLFAAHVTPSDSRQIA